MRVMVIVLGLASSLPARDIEGRPALQVIQCGLEGVKRHVADL